MKMVMSIKKFGKKQTVLLPIEGVVSNFCKVKLERVLKMLPKVTEANVDLSSSSVAITGTTSIPDLVAAICRAGFIVPAVITAHRAANIMETNMEHSFNAS
jgi:hypothetical protein